jgi:hypothetical protein
MRRWLVVAALAAWAALAIGGAGGAVGAVSQRSSAVATPMFVRFAFHASVNQRRFGGVATLRGSGTLKLSDIPAALTYGDTVYVTSTITIHHGSSSATFSVHTVGSKYAFAFNKRHHLVQRIRLPGHITHSTIRACRVGSSGTIAATSTENEPEETQIISELCGGAFQDVHATISIVPKPRPVPLPAKLTLTVNGESCTAFVGKVCHRPGEGGESVRVPSLEPLNIKAEANEPMPHGWEIQIRRTADPLSSSGNYYLVCSTKTEDSCEGIRPGLNARNGDIIGIDFVYAVVLSPTGNLLYAQIGVDWVK